MIPGMSLNILSGDVNPFCAFPSRARCTAQDERPEAAATLSSNQSVPVQGKSRGLKDGRKENSVSPVPCVSLAVQTEGHDHNQGIWWVHDLDLN